MYPHPKAPRDFLLLGGHVGLDLLNTRVNTRKGPAEMLDDFAAVVRFGVAVRALQPATAETLRERFAGTTAASALPARLQAFREDVRAGLRGAPSPEALARIDAAMRTPPLVIESLSHDGRRFVSVQRVVGDDVAGLLWPFARWARALLLEVDARTIGTCENPACGLLFLQKPAWRRWCSPRLCGHRDVMRRHYQLYGS